MAEITRKRQGELQRAVFAVLYNEPDGLPVTDVVERARPLAPPTEFELTAYESGAERYGKIIRFSTIQTVKAGWLVKDSGVWRLTAEGREAYDQITDPSTFAHEAVRLYKVWKDAQPDPDVNETDFEVVDEAGKVQHGWLVRGANVHGLNAIPDWLDHGYCSIAAPEIGEIPSGLTRSQIADLVVAGYGHLNLYARGQITSNLHAFLTQMSVGDLVVTVNDDAVHVGTVTGDPTYVDSSGKWTSRRRPVHWANREGPIKRRSLTDAAQAKLRGQRTVSDVTAVVAEFATRAGIDTTPDIPTPPPAEVALPPADSALADELLLPLAWLDECVELLTDKRQIVLYGPPGTGKTYLAQRLARHLAGEDAVRLVQFHPSYAYEDFFEGFRPKESADASGGLVFAKVPGPFRRLVDDARESPAQPFILIIDEINRANLAKVFGELYFLLEYREEAIGLQYSPDEDFTLPKNVFLIGTMNTADRSIALVDVAMRRRFAFQALVPGQPPIDELLRAWLTRKGLPTEAADLLDELNRRIGDPDFAVGPSYCMTHRVAEDGGLARIWRTGILPLLEEHYYGEDRPITDEFGLPTLRKALQPAPVEPDMAPPPEVAAAEPGQAP